MGVHSGKFGAVNGVSTSSGWSLTESTNARNRVASNTKCGNMRREGPRDWTGVIRGLGGTPYAMPGEIFTFTGYTAPDDDVSGTGTTATGSAMVTSITVNWGWGDSAFLNWSMNFGGHLALTWDNAGTQITDSTNPADDTTCGTKAQYSAGTKELTDLVTATLTISCDVKPYVNSSTYTGGKCWTGRKAGPIDLKLDLSQQCTERNESGTLDGAPPLGTNLDIRLFVDGTDYWEIDWCQVTGYSNMDVNTETGDIVARTINTMHNMWNGTTTGKIVLPGAGSNYLG